MNTTDYAQISSSNIRFLLTKNNMSIRQLAEKIGIAATTLNDSLKSFQNITYDFDKKFGKSNQYIDFSSFSKNNYSGWIYCNKSLYDELVSNKSDSTLPFSNLT